MSEKKNYDKGLNAVGNLIREKRVNLGSQYRTREKFVELRSEEIFNSEPWISARYLSSLEEGKNWVSIPMLLYIAAALEEDPVNLFREIINVYRNTISD